MWPFKFKGMIYPHMGMTWADSFEITKRKSICMVHYLRARRAMNDPSLSEKSRSRELVAKQVWRKNHFSE
jgi:hypothetical protein